MRKTLTILTVIAAATSLAACDKFFNRETATTEGAKAPPAATETATTTTAPAETAGMNAEPVAPTEPAKTAPATK